MKKLATTRRRARAGFTLLEVLLVLAILGVIGAMVVPQLLGQQKKAMVQTTQASIKNFEDAVELYAVGNDGEYPQGTEETVIELLMSPVDPVTGQSIQPILDEIPMDAWKNPLKYEYPPSGNHSVVGSKPAIWSIGPDKQDGSDDDVTNWQQNL